MCQGCHKGSVLRLQGRLSLCNQREIRREREDYRVELLLSVSTSRRIPFHRRLPIPHVDPEVYSEHPK